VILLTLRLSQSPTELAVVSAMVQEQLLGPQLAKLSVLLLGPQLVKLSMKLSALL
jgi:hypothetical protein